MRLLCIATACLALLLPTGGCSPRAEIAASSTSIRHLAESSKDKFEVIYSAAVINDLDPKVVASLADAGSKEQDQIISKTDTIAKNVPKVNDEHPWMGLLTWISVAVVLSLALAFLIFTPIGRGLSALVGNAASWVASLLPTPSAKLGKALAKAEDPNEPKFTMEHFTAVAREVDPVLKKSYLRARKKNKSPSGQSSLSSGSGSESSQPSPT